jgi:hypothetical protein
MPYFGASLAGDAYSVIYERNMFTIQATAEVGNFSVSA